MSTASKKSNVRIVLMGLTVLMEPGMEPVAESAPSLAPYPPPYPAPALDQFFGSYVYSFQTMQCISFLWVVISASHSMQ
jgi:hypothetical protein